MSMIPAADEEKWWATITSSCAAALKGQDRHFVTLECCANNKKHCKPDTMKWLLLWELSRSTPRLSIHVGENVEQEHEWLYKLFVPSDEIVLFPCNTGDCDGQSIYWENIEDPVLPLNWQERLKLLPRYSTASRSSLALVPESADNLKTLASLSSEAGPPITHIENSTIPLSGFCFDERSKMQTENLVYVNTREWNVFEASLAAEKNTKKPPATHWVNRAYRDIPDVGRAAAKAGIAFGEKKKLFRLYSVKTGVHYVGSAAEPGKISLEDNSELSMSRSNVIRAVPLNDPTFGIQAEILTVTAVTADGRADGYQVRDLSCLKPKIDYIPAQAIPYVSGTYDRNRRNVAKQVQFWRERFAVPLGRAKARMFLNFGLIHSGNAQNYVLGFNGIKLKQFIVRDIADTSWHQDYLEAVTRTAITSKAYAVFAQEWGSDYEQTLTPRMGVNYRSPRILRLAAHVILSRGFAKRLGAPEGGAWAKEQVYTFNRGVIDGFRSYMEEALNSPPYYPKRLPANKPMDIDGLVTEAGSKGAYPYIGTQAQYEVIIEKCLAMGREDLLIRAAYLARNGTTRQTAGSESVYGTDAVLINAEELFLCTAIELQIQSWAKSVSADKQSRTVLGERLANNQWPPIVKNP